jgi:hypothetical protein
MAAVATRIDMDRVRRMRNLGYPIEIIAERLGTTSAHILDSARKQGMDFVPEPEADVRARWERRLPGMKADLVREIIRDRA